MARKKPELPADCMPNCENCNAGRFNTGEEVGECRLLPMDWIVIADEPTPMWKPCYREGWCRHFERKTH